MSQPNLKEDLEIIAALTAGTAGFITNNINKMMVGDSNFVKTEMQPRDILEKAKQELVKAYGPTLQKTLLEQAPPVIIKPEVNQPELGLQQHIWQRPHIEQPVKVETDDKQLMFNFDNSPTAQNIFYKLNVIMEKLDSLNVKVHALSEQVNKKKVSNPEKKR